MKREPRHRRLDVDDVSICTAMRAQPTLRCSFCRTGIHVPPSSSAASCLRGPTGGARSRMIGRALATAARPIRQTSPTYEDVSRKGNYEAELERATRGFVRRYPGLRVLETDEGMCSNRAGR